MTILLIDNYDSFTYNIYNYFSYFNYPVIVKRNDKLTINEIIFNTNLKAIIISPGPCTPNDSGISLKILEYHNDIKLPILGICLGHQAIAQYFGCNIIRSTKPMHGKVTLICHQNHKLFDKIPTTFKVARYHSLIIDKKTLTNCLSIIASDREQIIMAISHNKYPIYGLQFHPESVGSEYGYQIFKNFLNILINHRKDDYSKLP